MLAMLTESSRHLLYSVSLLYVPSNTFLPLFSHIKPAAAS
eukprot:COSAG01_NODE_477_length_16509_cov_38.684217_24_plen_40_part_00